MKSEVFNTRGTKQPISLEQLRAILPFNCTEAGKLLERAQDMLAIEEVETTPVVSIDVSEGSYVRAIRFLDSTSLEYIFNEGSSKIINQESGIYSIGEKVYSFEQSILNSVDVNMNAYFTACSILRRVNSPIELANESVCDLLYKHLPSVRKNNEDGFYNYYDVNQTCKRIEVFRTYVTVAMRKCVDSIPDVCSVYIAPLSFSTQSLYIMRDLINQVNTSRRYKIVMQSASDVLDTDSYVYYFKDIWMTPSNLDHKICSDIDSPPRNDQSMENALGDDQKFITTKSSLVTGAYYPILDSFMFNGKLKSSVFDSFKYAQHWYVPHKPWTVVNLTTKNDGMLLKFMDRSDASIASRMQWREAKIIEMLYTNYARNFRLATHDQSEEMTPFITGELYEWRKEMPSFHNWELTMAMKSPILIDSKRVAYKTEVSVIDSTELLVKVSNMSSGEYYSDNALLGNGWSSTMISRGLDVGLIDVWKNGTIAQYIKVDPVDTSTGQFLGRVSRSKIHQVSLCGEDGNVHASQSKSYDDEVISYPLCNKIRISNKDYSKRTTYNPTKFSRMRKPVSKTRNFRFGPAAPIEYHEQCEDVSVGVKLGDDTETKERRWGDMLYDIINKGISKAKEQNSNVENVVNDISIASQNLSPTVWVWDPDINSMKEIQDPYIFSEAYFEAQVKSNSERDFMNSQEAWFT